MRSIVFLLAVLPVAAQVWPNGYSYRSTYTINPANNPSSDVALFVDTLNEIDTDLRLVANGGKVRNSSGYDIIYTSDPSGLSKINFERKIWNGTTGRFFGFVQVPVFAHSGTTVFYRFIGNPSISTDQSAPQATWDSAYKLVAHLVETSGTHFDSTSNANNSTSVTALVAQGETSTTVLAAADQFDGSTSNVQFPSINCGGSGITISAWVRRTSSSFFDRILSKEEDGFPTVAYLLLNTSLSTPTMLGGIMSGGSGLNVSSGPVSVSVWYLADFTYDGANMRMYLNGSLQNTTPQTGLIDSNASHWWFGGGSLNGQSFTGFLAEPWISCTARSADYIAAQYNSQVAGNAFHARGSLTTAPAGGGSTVIMF